MNNWRAIGVSGWLALQAICGQAGTLQASPAGVAPEIREPAASEKTGPAFTEDEQRRIRELRQWLMRRQLERKLKEPGGVEGLKETKALDLTIPDMANRDSLFRYGAAGQSGGNPILHIGRGPDGRIHHRLVFSDSSPEQPRSRAYEYDPPTRRAPAGRTIIRDTSTLPH